MKLLKISDCTQCPEFDNEYYTYDERCTYLDRVIPSDEAGTYIIPDDCPLDDAE